jgi:pyruvate/2-oxoglutarate dehydrogenase complex dihydrolipoamide acyltransferase (E2) component
MAQALVAVFKIPTTDFRYLALHAVGRTPVDHRAIDGALAARWLAAFTARVENPLSLLV